MPQMVFVQGIAIAAVVAILLVVLAMPVGARVGARAGRFLLWASLVGVITAFAGFAVWGAFTGDLAVFNARMGVGTWLQMGAFFGMVYFTGYRFVGSYLADKGVVGMQVQATHCGDQTTHTGGTDA